MEQGFHGRILQLLFSFPWQKPGGIEMLSWNAREAWLGCGSDPLQDRTGAEAGDVHQGLVAMVTGGSSG